MFRLVNPHAVELQPYRSFVERTMNFVPARLRVVLKSLRYQENQLPRLFSLLSMVCVCNKFSLPLRSLSILRKTRWRRPFSEKKRTLDVYRLHTRAAPILVHIQESAIRLLFLFISIESTTTTSAHVIFCLSNENDHLKIKKIYFLVSYRTMND